MNYMDDGQLPPQSPTIDQEGKFDVNHHQFFYTFNVDNQNNYPVSGEAETEQ